MISLSDISPRAGAWITPQIAVFILLALSAPFWLTSVGLYQYLGIEVGIWIIYALGFNLLFGYAGLHSFGHGAYLGVGAYAFGLFQHHVAVSLWGGLVAAVLAAGIAGALVGALCRLHYRAGLRLRHGARPPRPAADRQGPEGRGHRGGQQLIAHSCQRAEGQWGRRHGGAFAPAPNQSKNPIPACRR